MHRAAIAIVVLLMSGVPAVCVACASHSAPAVSEVVPEYVPAALNPDPVPATHHHHARNGGSMSEPPPAVAARSRTRDDHAGWSGTIARGRGDCTCCVDRFAPATAVGPMPRFAVAGGDRLDFAPSSSLNTRPSAVTSASRGSPPGADCLQPPTVRSPILRI